MGSNREFDIVLVGATGFVGRLTAAHLAARAGAVRVALAGRDRDRLQKVVAGLPAAAREWDLVVVDVTDAEQARELAARTSVVCSTVGPYEAYGKHLVMACAEAGTHYCDLTGETTFARWSVENADTVAGRTGARIVHSCGFDSVPSDLGVAETAAAAAAAGDGELGTTVTRVRFAHGGLSGGTIASMRGQMVRCAEDPAVRRLLSDPSALVTDTADRPNGTPLDGRGRTGRPGLGRLARRLGVEQDLTTGHWDAPFVMSAYNRQVVNRSRALAGGRGRFVYREVKDTGTGPFGLVSALNAALALGALFRGMQMGAGRAVLDRLLPAPGEGPSESAMQNGRYCLDVDAETTGGARYRTRFADGRDPGYTSTAVMLGEAALALAVDDLGRVSQRGGVHTPSSALGPLLVSRLRDQGFRIETGRL